MENQIEMKEYLKKLLYCITCKGLDFRDGGCPQRCDDQCQRINKLDICMIDRIANHLIDHNCIALPCKPCDTVYMPWNWYGFCGIQELKILSIKIAEEYQILITDFYSTDEEFWDEYDNGVFEFNQIGKKIFFTYGEAEKVLTSISD